MKILKIEFKNVNSLQGQHTIDFTQPPFHGDSLFAITGPTGAGKSTILDVITLALFNEIPRLGKMSKTEVEIKGAILTRGQKDAFARVVYQLENGMSYTSEWSISTNKNGNLRDYEMQLYLTDSGQQLVEKKSSIPAKNEELIGLKYDQFRKSVILAQGAFAEFLKVDKKERAELLEKITGTGIYRELGKKAFETYRVFKNEIEELKFIANTFRNELIEDEVVVELKQAVDAVKDTITKAEEKLKISDEKIKLKEDIAVQQKRLKIEEDNKLRLLKETEDFNQKEGKLLNLHNLAAPFEDDLKNWQRLNNQLISVKKNISDNNEKSEKLNRKKHDLITETSQLIQKEIQEANYSEQLSDFERNVLDIRQKRDGLKSKGEGLKSEINSDLRPLGIVVERDYKHYESEFQENLKNASEFIQQSIFKDLNEKDLENRLETVTTLQGTLLEAKSKAEHINRLENAVNTKNDELQSLTDKSSKFPESIEKLDSELTIAAQKSENLQLKKENHLLYASLEEKRQHLVDGEPCPLCGSLEHPLHPDFKEDKSDLDIELAAAKEQEKEIQLKLTELNSELKSLQVSSEKISNELQSDKTELEHLLKEFERKFSFELYTAWDTIIAENQSETVHLKQLLQKFREKEIFEIVLPKLTEITKVYEEAITHQESLKTLYPHKDPVEDRVKSFEQNWNSLISDIKIISSRKIELESEHRETENELNPLHVNLISTVRQTDFEDIPAAISALLSFDKRTQLEQQRDQLRQRTENTVTTIRTLSEILEKSKEKDDERSVEDLLEEKDSLSKSIVEDRKTMEENNRLLKNQEFNLARISDIQKEIDQKEKDSRFWKLLNDLIGDANGKNFNNFAQHLTLIQLIHLANLRLDKLSRRYLIASPNDAEDDALVIVDKEMGNQLRSVKTLSGGETFIISLALALALSDLASDNVQIKSLFIDEGFGTLDPETLDVVLTTLEQLQEEGAKMIGIISHVDSLKERISTQIQVIPNGRGFSSVKLTG